MEHKDPRLILDEALAAYVVYGLMILVVVGCVLGQGSGTRNEAGIYIWCFCLCVWAVGIISFPQWTRGPFAWVRHFRLPG